MVFAAECPDHDILCEIHDLVVFCSSDDQFPAEKQLEIEQVRRIRISYEAVTPAFLARFGFSADSMDVDLRLGGEVVVDHISQDRDINASSCNIRDDED